MISLVSHTPFFPLYHYHHHHPQICFSVSLAHSLLSRRILLLLLLLGGELLLDEPLALLLGHFVPAASGSSPCTRGSRFLS